MKLSEVDTPALLLDRGKFAANCDRMIAACRKRQVLLRPHMKTLKSIDAARIAMDPQHGGIAVATLNEAEYFASHGLEDIQLAVCLPPNKLERAAALLAKAPRFSFFVDSVDVAHAIVAHGAPFNVWIELDCGEHRTGVCRTDRLLKLAQTLTSGGVVSLIGVATHGGHSYQRSSPAAIAAVAEDERRAILSAIDALKAEGIGPLKASAGSTPTAVHGISANGLSELRAGVYMAGDLFQAQIGCLDENEIAGHVLSTVISRDDSRGRVIIDAGGLALSKDRSTAGRSLDFGYGLVSDRFGRPLGKLCVSEVHQEHGEILCNDSALLSQLEVGSLVRIVPNHICMTAAMYDRLLVIEADEVREIWPRTNGWSRVE